MSFQATLHNIEQDSRPNYLEQYNGVIKNLKSYLIYFTQTRVMTSVRVAFVLIFTVVQLWTAEYVVYGRKMTLDDNLSLNPNRCHHPLITQLYSNPPVQTIAQLWLIKNTSLFPTSYQNYQQNQQKLDTFLENFKNQSFQKVSLIKVGLQIKYSF